MTSATWSDDLKQWISRATTAGVRDETIVALLRQNGWSERRVYRALTDHYSSTLGFAVPSRGGYAEHARDAFYYLLNFITLGFWTIALGQVWYTLIARWFPDPAYSAYAYTGSLTEQISWQVATIVVAFPIYAFVHAKIRRMLAHQSEAYDSGVRKWLTYLALVLAALVVLSDGVFFVNALLRGELTMRFILDSLVLLGLGGGVFGYYFATIGPPEVRA